jgi:hypothetical protein
LPKDTFDVLCECGRRVSGDYIGKNAAADQFYLVFQSQLALFQALQLELVKRRIGSKLANDIVKITMFAFQFTQPRAKLLLFPDVSVTHRPGSSFLSVLLPFPGLWQFADILHLFFNMRGAAGLLDGSVEVCLLAQSQHRRMFG